MPFFQRLREPLFRTGMTDNELKWTLRNCLKDLIS